MIARVISRVQSFVLQGIEVVSCEIEADLGSTQVTKITMAGLPDTAVRESIERVGTASLNSGFRYPRVRTRCWSSHRPHAVSEWQVRLSRFRWSRTVASAFQGPWQGSSS